MLSDTVVCLIHKKRRFLQIANIRGDVKVTNAEGRGREHVYFSNRLQLQSDHTIDHTDFYYCNYTCKGIFL